MKQVLLGSSGLRVSELCLGTMTFGTEWAMGADHETSKGVFECFAHAGGTFIDTANRYHSGVSEEWTGEFIHSDRDHFVLATKYTLSDRAHDVQFSGNHRKNMMRSVQASLKRLNTEFIDVLWLHAWDFSTPVEEVMRGLDDLISRGLVHYIGISDTPAWVVSQANTLAHFRGWNSFVALQIEYSLLQRTPDRDLLPMAKAMGMTVTPWGALGGGALTGKYLKGEKGRVAENSLRRNERSQLIAETVVAAAAELNCSAAAVALAWTRQRGQSVIPIVGARTDSQLQDSLSCLDVVLPTSVLQKLDEVSAVELGFPHDFLSGEAVNGAMGGTLSMIEGLRK